MGRIINIVNIIFAKSARPLVYCGGAVVGTLDSHSRESGFESSLCNFEALAISFTPHCHSSLSYINKYLATDRGENVN